MNLLLCLFYLHIALASSSQDHQISIFAPKKLNKTQLWDDFVGNPDKQTLEFLRQLPVNYQHRLMKTIFDRGLDVETRMRIVGLLIEAGADLREALIEGLNPHMLDVQDDRSYFELFAVVLSELGPLLSDNRAEEPPYETLYGRLVTFSIEEEYFLKAFALVAKVEPFSPFESEVSTLMSMRYCDKHVDAKTLFLHAYLDHPKSLPIYNCLLVFAWSQNIHHYRLDGRSLVPTTDYWFEPVKPCLIAGKQTEIILYILQCRRLGASLLEKIQCETISPSPTGGHGFLKVQNKPILQFVAEEIPDHYRDLLTVLIIPADFPKSEFGEALDIDLNNLGLVKKVYGLNDVDAVLVDGSCTYRQLIMRARRLRAKHAAFIESIMAMAGEQQFVVIQATIGVLMAMIALETGHWIA